VDKVGLYDEGECGYGMNMDLKNQNGFHGREVVQLFFLASPMPIRKIIFPGKVETPNFFARFFFSRPLGKKIPIGPPTFPFF